MRKIGKIFLCFFLLIFPHVSKVYAEDENLELNMEELKNKKDTYSSLTDINGLNVFTNDVQSALQKTKERENRQFEQQYDLLFTGKTKTEVDEEGLKNLFNEPVNFDKNYLSTDYSDSIIYIIIIVTILIGIIIFLGTRRYYMKKGSDGYENNFDFKN